MRYFPLAINLQSQSVLVVGGGQVAFRKVTSLQTAGAKITVIAPSLCKALQRLFDSKKINWHQFTFEETEQFHLPQTLQKFKLIICATNNHKTNLDVSQLALDSGVLVNSSNQHDQGNVIFPAVIDRGDVVVTVSTNGQSPTITRHLKRQLEAFVPTNIEVLSRWAESWRATIKQKISTAEERQQFWGFLLSGKIKRWVLANKTEQADAEVKHQLQQSKRNLGQVFLVGAGPGDPDLLTVKALKLIQQAEVVLYDRLVSEPIMQLVPSTCERIYVGKRKADHVLPQANINQLLVDLAKQGKRVLRLKGGDPFIFGRGGEELELLSANSISFQVVPGITAASGCASYAGIPLTHRDYAQSVQFIAGQLQNNDNSIDWLQLANPNQTLVFYMGLSQLSHITSQLISVGLNVSTPIAIVEKGTTEYQRTIISTLADVVNTAAKKKFNAPTLIIIGQVVQLQKKLDWFT
jgi:uroporphyrin-III C-methyltransferase/precorrin-2 dehydrogenase/sirohydrochlorin ferrochelatase